VKRSRCLFGWPAEDFVVDWITDAIAIGNFLEAQDTALLRQSGFRSALSLDGTLAEDEDSRLGLKEIVSIRLIDGAGNDMRLFRFAVDALTRLASSQAPVLVQCHAGRSRSAAVVAGYLIAAQDMQVERALAYIRSRREVNLATALETLLFKFASGWEKTVDDKIIRRP
jgi:protein-tyrosine phosphatase